MVTNGNGENGISKKRADTCERIIKALKENQGLLSLAAKKADVSYTTMYRYVTEFPSVAQAVKEAKEALLDFAEGKLYQKMQQGDMTALIFYLKTQGKRRNYTERQEVTGAEGAPLQVQIVVSSEKAKALTEEIVAGKGTG